MAPSGDFQNVELPPGLTKAAIRKAIDYVERELAELTEIYFEQANLFSGLVSIYATKGLDRTSIYEKRQHSNLAQTRFPDLRRRGSPDPPPAEHSLECKASKRPWAVQSHYDHPGWYIVWRYLVDDTQTLEPGKPVIIWRVDVAYINQDDWKYEKSTASSEGGGRTETFGLKRPATKLRGKAVYTRSDVVISKGKAVPANGD